MDKTPKQFIKDHQAWLEDKTKPKPKGKDYDLSESYFYKKDLREADLNGVDLSEANIRGADLRGADLRGTIIDWEDFRLSNYKGATLDGELLIRVLENSNEEKEYITKYITEIQGKTRLIELDVNIHDVDGFIEKENTTIQEIHNELFNLLKNHLKYDETDIEIQDQYMYGDYFTGHICAKLLEEKLVDSNLEVINLEELERN